MNTVHCVEVFRKPCSTPGDLRGVQTLIDQRALPASQIVAVVGKTEGDGCVNDHMRDFAATSWCHFLELSQAASPAQVAERLALMMSGGTESVLSPHFTVFSRGWAPAGHRQEQLVVGIAHSRHFHPEEIGRGVQMVVTATIARAAEHQVLAEGGPVAALVRVESTGAAHD